GILVRVEFGDATVVADPIGANAIARSFPHTYGGYDMLGRIKDQIRTTEQVNSVMVACKALNLDGLDIVVGVPVTLNGDLKNQFVETNVGFDTICKYYYFIRIMGRKASHVAVECTLQSHPNMEKRETCQSTKKKFSGPGTEPDGYCRHCEREATTRDVIPLFRTETETVIERFRRVTLKTYGSSAKSRFPLPATTGQWSPSDPNTLLPALCCRNDDVASKFLKKNYNLPKKL
nr:pyrophosphate--fructose 6-phosphate 1-phosphotransferase subunit alpha [Tanacetum cinerariifolium]